MRVLVIFLGLLGCMASLLFGNFIAAGGCLLLSLVGAAIGSQKKKLSEQEAILRRVMERGSDEG